jgi:acid-sensing ion channel, other
VRNENFNDLYETDKKWALQFVPVASSKIFIHSIDEVSGYDFRPIFKHDVGYAVTLMITMKQTYTTEEAELLSVAQRKCIFPDERKLQYYKDDVYSFSQCMRQCRMERANFYCRCIPPFYLPENAFKYRQCGIEDIICLLKHVSNITNIKACKHCELSCHNTVYDVEKFSKVYVE